LHPRSGRPQASRPEHQPSFPQQLASTLTSAFIRSARSVADHPEEVPSGGAGFEVDRPEELAWLRTRGIGRADVGDGMRALFPDVEASLERFAIQDRVLREAGLPTPAARINGDAVPIDIGLSGLLGVQPDTLRRIVSDFAHAPTLDTPTSLHTELVAPDQAEEGLRNRLTRFLRTGLSARRQHRGVPSSNFGYAFEVSTDTDRLRIHYSPAYFINTNLVFGAPTSPVIASLPPGRYIFGAYPVGYWSNAEYDVPGPSSHAHLDV
jgi:hypothetical protein